MPGAGGFVRHYLRPGVPGPPESVRGVRGGQGEAEASPRPPTAGGGQEKDPPHTARPPLPSSCPHGRLPSLGKGALLGPPGPLPASRSIGHDALRLQESHRCASPPLM